MERKDFFYEDDNQKVVTFEMNEKTLMVNATEMAKIFDKDVFDFMKNEGTKSFIQECLKTENSRFINVKTEKDLFYSRQKTGTWMHKILAIKFAAWLNPKFELWVYYLIEKLLFADYASLKQSVKKSGSRRSKIEKLKNELRSSNKDFLKLEELESEEKAEARNRSRQIVTQIKIFQDVNDEEE